MTALGSAYVPVEKIYNLTDHWFPDKTGGSCLYAYKLHRLLSQHLRTETVTLIGEPSPYEKDMVVHKVLRKGRFLQNRRAIRALGGGTNVLWVVHSPWFFLHLFFALGFKVRNQVVGIYHGPWFREYYVSAAAKKNVLAKLLLSLLRYVVELFYSMYVERFIFLSEKMYRATSEYLPIARSKVHIIPMWSDKNGWDHPSPKGDRLILSTFRRLEPRMGVQDLLLALQRCDLKDYRLLIGGDGPYKTELVKLVERLGLQNTVQLLGWVSEEEKAKLIRESDAVIIPSRCLEGFSLLALESLEHGTPVVLTEAVGFYEYVRDMEQDFVKKVDLENAHVEMQEFMSQSRARVGLDRIEALFNATTIGRRILRVMTEREAGARSPAGRT
jgi:glycosyltransferase involved in cell wall biosynthesis